MGLLGIRKQTISATLPDKLKDQYCFKTEAAIKCLKFVKNMQNRTFISVGTDAISLMSAVRGCGAPDAVEGVDAAKSCKKNKIRDCIICQSCVIIQPVSAMTLIEIGA